MAKGINVGQGGEAIETPNQDIAEIWNQQGQREPLRRPGLVKQVLANPTAALGAGIVIIIAILVLLAPMLAPYSPLEQDLRNVRAGPSDSHWLGTDQLGRDLLSRILYGLRLTVPYSILGAFIGLIIGVPIGVISGYYSWLDAPLMRTMDIILSFPSMLLAIAITAALGVSLLNASIAIGLIGIPAFARLIRGSVLTVKKQEFVEAARGLGAATPRLLFRHILPNCLTPIIVLASINIATAVLMLASLSFLGLGAQPPTAELGAMLADGRGFFRSAPHIGTFPGIVIAIIVLGFNLLGDGLRDALDPHE